MSEHNYTIEPVDFEQAGRAGYVRVAARVHGYWSSDPVALRITRKLNYVTMDQAEPVWEFTMEHSSGGRCTKTEPDDLVAAQCFSDAIANLCRLGVQLRSERVATFEANFQAQRREYEEARAKAKAELEARQAADPAMGALLATSVIDQMVQRLEEGKGTRYIAVARGTDQHTESYISGSMRKVYMWSGYPISRAQLLIKLSECSTRSHFADEVKS